MGSVTYLKLSELVDAGNARITTVFRQKGSIWSSGWHNGTDIAASAGSPIKAAADGVVVNADTAAHNDGYGNRVILKHADGKATLYAHMVAPATVKVGQTVKRGQVIGKVGSTGLSTGAHLHVSVIDNYDKNPNIYYKGDLLDPAAVFGLGTFKTEGASTATDGSSTAASGSSDASFKVGDIVNFTGTTHYESSTGTRGTSCKPGKAKVTQVAAGTAHPYHLIAESGGSNVYGWVNASDIEKKKSVDELAKEVIAGKWSSGQERCDRLTAAGYSYDDVQKRVNELIY